MMGSYGSSPSARAGVSRSLIIQGKVIISLMAERRQKRWRPGAKNRQQSSIIRDPITSHH